MSENWGVVQMMGDRKSLLLFILDLFLCYEFMAKLP